MVILDIHRKHQMKILVNAPSVTCENCGEMIAMSLLQNHRQNCIGGPSSLSKAVKDELVTNDQESYLGGSMSSKVNVQSSWCNIPECVKNANHL